MNIDIINTNVTPPMSWLSGFCMLITSFCIITQAMMNASGDLGYKTNVLPVRAMAYIVGVIFIAGGIRIFFIPSISIWAVAMACAMATWRLLILIFTIVDGWQREAIRLVTISNNAVPGYNLDKN